MEHLHQDELQAYLDGTLPPEEGRAVRAHVDGCAECRAELALLREVDEALRAWPVLPEPEGLTVRVMAAVQATTPVQTPPPWEAPWPWLRVHWSEVLLGAVLVATVVVLVVSARALGGVRDHAGLRFWELQAERALAQVERVWYAIRADAGSDGWDAAGAGSSRPGMGPFRPARYAAQFYCWVAGAIAGAVALGAGAVSVRVLAQQRRQGLRVST